MKEISKEEAQKMLQKVLGNTYFKDLPEHEASYYWSILKNREHCYESSSFHIYEKRYSYNGQIYQVLWAIGGKSDEFMSVGVETNYDWNNS